MRVSKGKLRQQASIHWMVSSSLSRKHHSGLKSSSKVLAMPFFWPGRRFFHHSYICSNSSVSSHKSGIRDAAICSASFPRGAS